MTPEQWQQVERLYHSALEREENQRAAFLQEACAGDEALRREVESLLANADQAKSFLESPALEVAAKGLAGEQAPSLVGRQLGSHQILSLLGAGGMGEVYRARDSKLRRDVAIKVLPEAFAKDPERLARFRQEARLLASLNHPNIATIHGLEESEGVHYLVLELVEGDTLAERITQAGPVPMQDALNICRQITEALEAAHAKGVIHRDLKPANIKVTPEGRVKVLDFGLAKALWSEGSSIQDLSQLPTLTGVRTQEGRILGTPAYMSPEQVRGKVVDKQADTWAFGCVVYELLTGKGAFHAETLSDTLARVLEREPDWEMLPPSTPGQVRHLLRRCLEKDSTQRLRKIRDARIEIEEALAAPRRPGLTRRQLVATAGVALVALLAVPLGLNLGGVRDRLLGTAIPAPIESIAVLPFANLSGDPEQDYFAAGITDALITDLAKISGLRKVIARASVMRYRNTDKPLPQIGRELGVDAIITGAVFREGGRVRITAQLINAATEEHLWAERYERELRDVLSLQNDIVVAIIQEMRLQLTPQEQTRLASAQPVNPEAYEAYLKGRFFLNRLTPEGFEQGLEYLNQATELDPANPMVYAGLALGYTLVGHDPIGIQMYPDAYTRARAATRRARELGGETLAETVEADAEAKLYLDWNFAGLEQDFQRVIELNPSLAEAHAHYSWYLRLVGRNNEALAEMRRAMELDPLNPIWPAWLGWQYWWVGQSDEAIEEVRKSLDLNAEFAPGLYVLGSAYAEKGMYEEAVAAHQKLVDTDPAWRWALPRTYALANRRDEAQEIAAEIEKEPGPFDTWGLAGFYTALGEKDEAFRWLEAGFDVRFSYMPWIERVGPLAPLRDDPRFQDLVRRIGIPQ